MSTTTASDLVPVPEACRILGGIGRTTLWRLARAGEVTKVKVGSRTMFLSASINDYISRRVTA